MTKITQAGLTESRFSSLEFGGKNAKVIKEAVIMEMTPEATLSIAEVIQRGTGVVLLIGVAWVGVQFAMVASKNKKVDANRKEMRNVLKNYLEEPAPPRRDRWVPSPDPVAELDIEALDRAFARTSSE